MSVEQHLCINTVAYIRKNQIKLKRVLYERPLWTTVAKSASHLVFHVWNMFS